MSFLPPPIPRDIAASSASSSRRWRLAQYLERYWWRRYLRHKTPADYLAEKTAYWQRTLETLNWQPLPGRRVLDAGCGPAGVFLHLHTIEAVTALDPLLEHYADELDIFSPDAYPQVTFLSCPLEATIPGPAFAAIYCFNAINHVADWGRALDVLTAAAAPGCRMILTSDVHHRRWLRPIFRALPGDLLHPQQHSAAEYRQALAARGWTIEKEVVLREETVFHYVGWVAVRHGHPYP